MAGALDAIDRAQAVNKDACRGWAVRRRCFLLDEPVLAREEAQRFSERDFDRFGSGQARPSDEAITRWLLQAQSHSAYVRAGKPCVTAYRGAGLPVEGYYPTVLITKFSGADADRVIADAFGMHPGISRLPE